MKLCLYYDSSDVLQVLKLIQIIAQARQTAKRISDNSAEAAANNSFLSWFSVGSSDPSYTFSGGEVDDMGECVKKTHEFLDKALDYLCQIFRVSLLITYCHVMHKPIQFFIHSRSEERRVGKEGLRL